MRSCIMTKCGKFGADHVLYYLKSEVAEKCSSIPEVRKWIGGDVSTARRFGVITKVHRKGLSYQVKWHGNDASTKVWARDIRMEKKGLTSASILSVMIMVGEEALFEAPDKSNWPKDLFDALVRSD